MLKIKNAAQLDTVAERSEENTPNSAHPQATTNTLNNTNANTITANVQQVPTAASGDALVSSSSTSAPAPITTLPSPPLAPSSHLISSPGPRLHVPNLSKPRQKRLSWGAESTLGRASASGFLSRPANLRLPSDSTLSHTDTDNVQSQLDIQEQQEDVAQLMDAAAQEVTKPALLLLPSISQFVVSGRESIRNEKREHFYTRLWRRWQSGNKITPAQAQDRDEKESDTSSDDQTDPQQAHVKLDIDIGSPNANAVLSARNAQLRNAASPIAVKDDKQDKQHLIPHRVPPNVFQMYMYYTIRFWIKHSRRRWSYLKDFFQTILVAVCIGAVFGSSWTLGTYESLSNMVVVAAAVSSGVISLSLFSEEKIMFWREYEAGLSVHAYYWSNVINQIPVIFMMTLLFTFGFHVMTKPHTDFGIVLLILWSVFFCCSAFGILFSILLEYRQALLCTTLTMLYVSGFMAGVSPNYGQMGESSKKFLTISFARWALEALSMQEYIQWNLTETELSLYEDNSGWSRTDYGFEVGIIWLMGIIVRLIGWLIIIVIPKGRRIG